MKKRNLDSLKLNKRKISSLKETVKGGIVPIESDCSSFGNGECAETYCNCKTQDHR
ncbi:MAG: hypothetical protein AAF611_13915 [Bacteroidota bacterium]